MMTGDARAELFARLARLRKTAAHPYGGLIDTPEGVRYVCAACGPIDAEAWAGPCQEGRR